MAHGNFSDLALVLLLAIVVQWWRYPSTLFEEVGPLKAQFSTKSADMDALIQFGGGLLLTIGLTFSGVKWNPINGKMAGFFGMITMGYTIYSCYKADSEQIVARPFYVYALVIFLGALHIFAFPSNPLPPKSPETKNNHGNASDLVALSLIAAALGCLFKPDHLFEDLGPVKAQFTTAKNDEIMFMTRFVGSLILIIAMMLSGVKWNPINGKMAGMGGFVATGYTAYSLYKADSDVFVPRFFYIYALFLFLGAVHVFVFPSNPLPPKAEKKD